MNEDPRKRYVWANPLDPNCGLGMYEALGYEVEAYEEGGVRPKAGRKLKVGEQISTIGDLVLMSVSKERYDEIVQHGPDGQSGQTLQDEIEERTLKARPGGLMKNLVPRGASAQAQWLDPEKPLMRNG